LQFGRRRQVDFGQLVAFGIEQLKIKTWQQPLDVGSGEVNDFD